MKTCWIVSSRLKAALLTKLNVFGFSNLSFRFGCFSEPSWVHQRVSVCLPSLILFLVYSNCHKCVMRLSQPLFLSRPGLGLFPTMRDGFKDDDEFWPRSSFLKTRCIHPREKEWGFLSWRDTTSCNQDKYTDSSLEMWIIQGYFFSAFLAIYVYLAQLFFPFFSGIGNLKFWDFWNRRCTRWYTDFYSCIVRKGWHLVWLMSTESADAYT